MGGVGRCSKLESRPSRSETAEGVYMGVSVGVRRSVLKQPNMCVGGCACVCEWMRGMLGVCVRLSSALMWIPSPGQFPIPGTV